MAYDDQQYPSNAYLELVLVVRIGLSIAELVIGGAMELLLVLEMRVVNGGDDIVDVSRVVVARIDVRNADELLVRAVVVVVVVVVGHDAKFSPPQYSKPAMLHEQ